jgi:hypothetical protein
MQPKQPCCFVFSIHDDKDVPTADDTPIATLPVPIAVPVRVPVGVIPIRVGVNCRAIIRMDSGPIGPAGMIRTISGTNGRATSVVDCRPITSLDCRAIACMSHFTVLPLIRIRVKTGGGAESKENC